MACGDVHGLGLALSLNVDGASVAIVRATAEHARLTELERRFPRLEKRMYAMHFEGEVTHVLRVNAAGTLTIKTLVRGTLFVCVSFFLTTTPLLLVGCRALCVAVSDI